jgi:hypothetical protein
MASRAEGETRADVARRLREGDDAPTEVDLGWDEDDPGQEPGR